MKRLDYENYKKMLNICVGKVDRAISKGAYLSEEEWFDFICKSAQINYRSQNITKYGMFNKELLKFAETYAEILGYAVFLTIDGFDNMLFGHCLKSVTAKLNKFIHTYSRIRVECSDRNGTLYIKLYKSGKRHRLFPVKNVEDAVDFLIALTGYATENSEIFRHTAEFSTFISGYFQSEYNGIISNKRPEPYIGYNDSRTLAKYLPKGTFEVVAS